MSWWCALWILVSKGQGRNALITENCRIIHQPSWNFTQRLAMSRGCVLLILGSKGQDHYALIPENGLWRKILISLYAYHHETSHIDSPGVEDLTSWFEVKGKITMHWLLKMVYDALLLSLYTYNHETSHTDFSWVKHVPYWFWGQDVKGQGHNALITENGLWCLIAFYLHQQSWNFTQKLPGSQGCALLNSDSKGQWLRSQCIDSCKWFMVLNCFLFTLQSWNFTHRLPMSRRCALLISGPKGQRSRSQCINSWKCW